MIETATNAKKFVCPLSFAVPNDIDEAGRHVRASGPFSCVAEKCMAWTWLGWAALSSDGQELKLESDTSAPKITRAPPRDPPTPWARVGTCGMCPSSGAY